MYGYPRRRTAPHAPSVLLLLSTCTVCTAAPLNMYRLYCAHPQVEPLLRERVTLSSEVGRSPATLAAEFPVTFQFPADMPAVWWWRGRGDANVPAVHAENTSVVGGVGGVPGLAVDPEPEGVCF